MPRWLKKKSILVRLFLVGLLLNGAYWYYHSTQRQLESFVVEQSRLNQEKTHLAQSVESKQSESELFKTELDRVKTELTQVKQEYETLKSQDQLKRNEELQAQIKSIEATYDSVVDGFEALQKVKDLTKDTDALEKLFATALSQLSKRDYTQAGESLKKLNADLSSTLAKLSEKPVISTANVPVNNAAPGSGFSRQQVQAESGTYLVDLIAGNLDSTRVIVDTASDGTCGNDCPVTSLADYVSRSGGFAGINGAYFCPAGYPSCAGKTNSFDTLLMNKNKVYFNSDDNVYSTVPAVIFGDGWVRFVGKSSDWGRDTGIDSMIANQPLLVAGGNSVFGGDGDPKKGSKGPRSFVANKGNTVYIGVVYNATVAESALALKALGMENGLNLDSGGSTALWFGGYKVGPGRNIPNAIVFVRK